MKYKVEITVTEKRFYGVTIAAPSSEAAHLWAGQVSESDLTDELEPELNSTAEVVECSDPDAEVEITVDEDGEEVAR